jgi:hypothetical protein
MEKKMEWLEIAQFVVVVVVGNAVMSLLVAQTALMMIFSKN